VAILTNSGRTALAVSLLSRTIHLAWGAGDPAWDTAFVQESIQQTSLVSEIGRRLPTSIESVIPDVNGDIVVPVFNDPNNVNQVRRYSVVAYATNYLYMRFNFDYTDAPASVIREVAVFSGCTTDPLLPPGQRYFAPGDVVESGILLAVQNLQNKLMRSPDSRQSYEFVLEI
jgi:hypothetical protein